MQKFLLVGALFFIGLTAGAQCITNVNFNTWSMAGRPGFGSWSVQGGGTQIYQAVNASGPTYFVSPFDLMNVRITGNFRTTDDDNDWMGFVFSFLNPMGATDSCDFWLFDWKQEAQDGASSGKSLCRVNGVIPPANYTPQFWDHTNSPEFRVIQNDFGGPGWNQGQNHAFEMFLTYNRVRIIIDGVPTFDWTDCFKPGRFGFYNYSQSDCIYSNFQYELYVDFSYPTNGVCRNSSAAFNFTNSCVNQLNQYQSMTWNFGDGSAPVVINNPTLANVNVTHTYTTAGNYTATLTVLDNNGCTATASHTVDVRNPIVPNQTLDMPDCNGGSDGGITLAPTGGFGGYSYQWSNGTSQSSLVGATAGTYGVTITDGRCNTTAQYTLTQPTALSATTSHTDAPCGSNGTATITITGGTPPYSGVNWAGFPAASGVPRSMPAGTWIADFRDANNCSALLQYRETITQLPCGINSSVTTTNVSCFGGSNGTATLTVTGGSGGSVTWTGGRTGFSISNLPAGTYTYNYTDANPALNFSGSVTITAPGAAMAAQITTVPIACAGSNTGQAFASVTSGGVAPYVYTWSGGHPNSPSVSNLGPGIINVTVTDSRGCTASATANISSVPSLTANVTTVMDSCYHTGRGSATVHPSGGNPPYTFAWNNLDTDTSNQNIIAGVYTVTVTDYNSCTVTASGTVGGPSTPFAKTFTTSHISCFGANDGNFNITTTGGTPGYTYTWNPSSVSGNNPTGLAAGVYRFTITDAYGCRLTGDDTLVQPATALTAVSSHTDVTCNGANNGTLTLTIGGGSPPYTYQGNPVPPGTTTLTNIPAGTYSGTVIDSAGCSVSVSETVLEPAVLTIGETHTDVGCNGASTGSITTSPGGGTLPYTFAWNDGVTTQDRTGIPAGNYSVVLTDSNSCSASVSVSITEPSALMVTETHTDVLCNGDNTGSITTTTTGGTTPYVYSWNDGATTPNRTSIPAGSYILTVTDNSLCSASLSVTVSEPNALVVTTSHTDVTCNGANNGTITVNISGGTAPYSYLGNPVPAGTTTIPNLPPNTYSGNVVDANGCSVAVSETITEPGPQSVTVTGTNNVCFGATQGTASATFINATGTPTYAWTGGLTGANISNLAAGTYTVTATDQNICTVTGSITITEPAAVTMSVTTIDAVCFGGNGSATATPSGGTPPFTYLWSNSSTGQTVSLPAGSYTVSSTDANTCQQTASLTINQPTDFVIQESHTNVQCFGGSDGTITLVVSGATPGYTYQWSPNISSNDSAVNLSAGSYSFTVTDANACTVTQSVSITAPAQITITATADSANCFGESSGSITTVTNGGVSPYSYVWNDAATTQDRTGIPAGTYTVTVSDANLCTATTSADVLEPAQLTAFAASVDVSCYHYTDGLITVSGIGGFPSYTYSLSTGAQNLSGTFSNLSVGSYTVTVTDANSCSASTTATINEPDSVIITLTPNVIKVNLGESIQLQASTNQPGISTYHWQPDAGLSCNDCANPTFTGNYSMFYTVTVVNDLGCSGSANVDVTVVPSYDVFIPNAFTPNGDGRNDTWQIFGNIPGIKQIEVMVFNRWGEKVFESKDMNFAWDGSYKGETVPAVYSYVAKFVWLNNHSDSDYVGTITLLK